jgi:hypothetical protein
MISATALTVHFRFAAPGRPSSSATSRIGNSAPPILTGSGIVRVSSVSHGASSSEGMRSTSSPVRRLRRGDFQGNPRESGYNKAYHVGRLSQGCSWLSIVTKVMICLILGFFCKSSQQPASCFKTDGMRQAAMQSSILVYRIFQPRVKFRGICWTDVVDHMVHSRPLRIVVHCRPFWIFFAHNASTPIVFQVP